jgi:cytochrome c oxidase cbb3-type subunit IV
MIQNVLNGIEGVGIYGVISIAIFFGFFTGMLFWASLQKKNYLNRMSTLPLDAGERNKDTNPENQR